MKNFSKPLLSLALLFLVNVARGQISVPNTTPVTENFNSMGTGTTLPANWRIRPTTPTTYASASNAVTQVANSGVPTAGGTYNWGNTSGADRAVGAMTSGSFSSPNSLMAWYRNTNSGNLISLTISYQAERYRVNTAAASINFFYSLDGSNWTAVPAGNIPTASFPTGASAYNFTPGLTVPVTPFTISSLSIPNGSDFYLRWEINTTGTNSQGIGIDEVSVTAAFSAVTPTFSFSTATATVAENGGSINVVVNQSIAAVCNVNVVRVGGTATPGTEFTFTSPTTLNFNGVVTSQTINIPIIDDLISDGTKTIILELQSATGSCTIGSPSQHIITITDNEVAPPTIFKPGDLVFVGFDANDGASGDDVFFMTMVDIAPGTNFSYVNSRFEAGAAACTRTLRWGGSGNDPNANPGILKFVYNGTNTIIKGSVIKFKTTGTIVSEVRINGGANIVGDFTITNPGTIAANISTGDPDQMWLVQGEFTGLGSGNVQLSGTVLYGMSMGVNWIPFNTACSGTNGGGTVRQSRLHPDVECFNFVNTSILEYAHYNIAAPHVGSKRQLLQNIATLSNWTTSTAPGAPPATVATTTFTINLSNPEGTWVGDASTNPNDWFTCGNWEGLAVPDENIDVVIPNVTNAPRIDVDGYSVGCAGAYTSTKYGGYAKAKSVTINGETLEFGNGTTNSGSTADRLDIFGDLTITNTAGGNLDMDAGTSPQDGTINLQGNWINNLGTAASFEEGNSNINFIGSSSQTITTAGGSETFHNLTFNNASGISLNSTNALVSGTATFTNGTVNAPNATTARMEFLAGSSHTGASANSHVNGWVRKVGNTAFTFPVGDAGTYAPASISAPTATDHHFTARYFKTSPHSLYNTGSLLSPLKNVSVCEYWIIDRTNGTSSVNVTLSYDDPRSCQTPDPAGLVVARWNGSQWVSEGQSAQTGTPTSGTITSNSVVNFSPFTLGNLTINPLPVELISFRGFVTTKGEAQLTWQVSAQSNIKGYAVEKSLDSKHFEQIGFVDAQNLTTYNFFDAKFAELSYYRLRIVETDGSYRYSQIISLDKNKTLTAQLLIYPNPAGEQDEIRVMIGGRDLASKLQTIVYGQSGKVLGEMQATLQETEMQLSQLLATQPKGLYIIHLQTENGETLTAKFVKK